MLDQNQGHLAKLQGNLVNSSISIPNSKMSYCDYDTGPSWHSWFLLLFLKKCKCYDFQIWIIITHCMLLMMTELIFFEKKHVFCWILRIRHCYLYPILSQSFTLVLIVQADDMETYNNTLFLSHMYKVHTLKPFLSKELAEFENNLK